MTKLKERQHVFDKWWPDRLGRIEKILKTIVRVRWADGDVWSYDTSHQKFLERLK